MGKEAGGKRALYTRKGDVYMCGGKVQQTIKVKMKMAISLKNILRH